MFISTALAADTVAAAGDAAAAASPFTQAVVTFAPLLLVLVIFYFFLVRPQQKRMSEFQKMVSALRRGDKIVTTGGIIGTIHRVEDNQPEITLEIAEGVRIKLQRTAIAEVLMKSAPANDAGSEQKSA
jgi:preprotein translocase subunit YajC